MSLRDDIVRVAREQIGKPYDTRPSYPWDGPASDYDSFNCSGLVRAVYDQCGVTIPGFQRASKGDSQSRWVMDSGNWHWGTDGLQPGDLVFWQDGDDWTDTYHVGIYTEDDMCVSSNGVNMGVCEHNVYIDGGFIGGGWPLSDRDGWEKSEWIKDGDRWWYRHEDGSYTKDDWERIDNKWYRFDSDGWMQTGWVKDSDGRWYYLSEEHDYTEGSMRTGWLWWHDHWYYMDEREGGPQGHMVTGWVKVSGKWYLMRDDGTMATGWHKDGDKWYYLDSNGEMVESDVRSIGGKWYAFGADGDMLYRVDADESGALKLTDTKQKED